MTLSKLLVDIPNPFTDGIVGNPWDFDTARTPDIQSIHANAFGICLRLLEQEVRRNGQCSLLIDGPAGSGKTHLIARLTRRIPTGTPAALLCYVNLDDVAPQMLWSHLRQRVAGDLLLRTGADGKFGLARLLEHRLPGLLATPDSRGRLSLPDWIRTCFAAPRRAQICTRLRQELFEQVKIDREARSALLQLFHEDAEQAQLSRDWLIGERLTDEQLTRLGLPTGDLSDQVREHQSREVVLSLLRLATNTLPVLLCFDQVEHLMHTLNDKTGYVRFGQMISKLRHEAGKGLFLVSFLRSDQVQGLKDAVGLADWARIAENKASLAVLTWHEAHQLILQRMNAVEQLRLLRQSKSDEYWPLDKRCLQEIYQRIRLTCTPRELLWECRNAFGGSDHQPPLDDYLLLKWQQRRQQKKTDSGGDRLLHALNGIPWLAELLGSRDRKIDLVDLQEALPDANIFLQTTNDGRIAFSACPRTPHLWRRLDRLSRDWQGIQKKLDCRRLVVLCDARMEGLPAGTQARLQAMRKLKGITVVHATHESTNGLDALHSLLTDANKGHLVADGRSVEVAMVHHWAKTCLAEAGHELGALRLFFDELGLELPTGPAPSPDLKEPVLAGNG